MAEEAFIAFDWCGWNDQYGRFTHMPSGDTLVCQGWMDQQDWDRAQLEWFQKYPGLTSYRQNHSGPYHKTEAAMGTSEEICGRLERRLSLVKGT